MVDEIAQLLETKWKEPSFESYFIVDILTSEGDRKIRVLLDGDRGINLEVLQKISRYLEDHLDENEHVRTDYILEVSSPGVENPIQKVRQFEQHIGRNFELELVDGTESNRMLLKVDEDTLYFDSEVDTRSKTQQKKFPKESNPLTTTFDKIKSAKVVVAFK